MKVYICQFLKGGACSELVSLRKLKNIKIERFGTRCFVGKQPSVRDRLLARQGLKAAQKAVLDGSFAVVVLDEINVAVKLGLLDLDAIMQLLKNTPPGVELVLTGRDAHPRIMKIADLVSDIKDRKHYYGKGVKARKGIEF